MPVLHLDPDFWTAVDLRGYAKGLNSVQLRPLSLCTAFDIGASTNSSSTEHGGLRQTPAVLSTSTAPNRIPILFASLWQTMGKEVKEYLEPHSPATEHKGTSDGV